METNLQPLNRIQRKLFDITVEWNDLEDDMGEQAALEVACSQNGVDSDWYYDNFPAEHEIVNAHLSKLYGKEQ
jgi:hypothetical protein